MTGKLTSPLHWPASDRDEFARLPPALQEWWLRRDAQMTADYTRKTQQASGSGHSQQGLAIRQAALNAAIKIADPANHDATDIVLKTAQKFGDFLAGEDT